MLLRDKQEGVLSTESQPHSSPSLTRKIWKIVSKENLKECEIYPTCSTVNYLNRIAGRLPFVYKGMWKNKLICEKKNTCLFCKWWCITLTGPTGFWSNRLVFVALSTTVRLFGVIFITWRRRIRHIQILNPIVLLQRFFII